MKKRIILFVCKHNRFRSKVAEALFNKYNKNKKWKAESTGTHLDKKRMYVASNVKKALRRFGVEKVADKPRKITKTILKKADLIINVADNVRIPGNLIKGKKVLLWNIADTSQENYMGILWRVYRIKGKVKKLIYSLL